MHDWTFGSTMDETSLMCSVRYALRDPVYTVNCNTLYFIKDATLLMHVRLHDRYGDAGVPGLHHQCCYISELTFPGKV